MPESAIDVREICARVVEQSSDAVFVVDRQGRCVFVNPSACALVGHERSRLVGTSMRDLVPPEDLEARPFRIEELEREGSVTGMRRLLRADGTRVYVELCAFRVDARHLGAIVREVGRISPPERAQDEPDLSDPRAAVEALRASEAKYRALFENAQVGMFRSRLDGSGFVDVNRKVCEILEGSREELLRLRAPDVWTDLADRDAMRAQIADRGLAELETQVTTLRGTIKTVRATFVLDPGTGMLEGTVIDVTERRHAEERVHASLREKEVLLREIHHRVKNNLQIISSLLHLQSTRTADERLRDALRQSESRVSSMALLHQRLYESSDLSEISFAWYVRDLARTLYDAYGISSERIALRVTGGEVTLSLALAVHCGLVLNELLSNALKHAFPGDRRGTITVEVARDADRLRLRVHDDGVGLPEDFAQRSAASLGTKLVDRLVAQLLGTVERKSGPTGTTIDVELPADASD